MSVCLSVCVSLSISRHANMPALPTPIGKENIKSFLNSFDVVLTDCDGE